LAVDFGFDVLELPVAAFLRAVAPKLRANVEELMQSAGPEFMLNICAPNPGRILGTKGKRLTFVALCAALVLPRVHLFRNDVSFLADSTSKKLGGFENWRANLVEI